MCSVQLIFSILRHTFISKASTLSLKVWSFTTHFPPHQCGAITLPRKCGVYPLKVWSFFYSTLGVHHNYTLLCHYKLSHCLPTCLSYSPFECLPACRSDCLSHCLWSVPLVACLCVFLFVCLSVVFLPVYLSACPHACLFVPLH